MYRCEQCQEVSAAGQKANRTIIETRPRKYENYNKRTKEVVITQGREVVKEIILCNKCAEATND